MTEIFPTNDNEKSLRTLELIDTMMSLQSHLMDLLEAERAPAAYIHGYCKAILDFSTLLYNKLQ